MSRNGFYIAIIVSLIVHFTMMTAVMFKEEKPEIEYKELKIKLGTKRISVSTDTSKSLQNYYKQMAEPGNYSEDNYLQKLSKIVQRRVDQVIAAEPELAKIEINKEANNRQTGRADTALLNKNITKPTQTAPANKQEKSAAKRKLTKKAVAALEPQIFPKLKPRIRELSPLDNNGFILGNSSSEDTADLVSYEQMLPLWLNKFREYPAQAQILGLEGSGDVFIKINRNGKVLLSKIIKSTGHPMLDRALMKMIIDADPVLPTPPDYYSDKKTFSYTINFKFVI